MKTLRVRVAGIKVIQSSACDLFSGLVELFKRGYSGARQSLSLRLAAARQFYFDMTLTSGCLKDPTRSNTRNNARVISIPLLSPAIICAPPAPLTISREHLKKASFREGSSEAGERRERGYKLSLTFQSCVITVRWPWYGTHLRP